MFSNFFYFFIVIILLSFIPDETTGKWIESPSSAFLLGIAFYILVLIIIYFQRSRKKTNLVNIELICFLGINHFILGAYRVFGNFQSLYIILSLLLYLGGLGYFHFISYKKQSIPSQSPQNYSLNQLRLIIPFCLPIIIITIISDFFPTSAEWLNSHLLLMGLSAILFTLILMCIMPPLMIYAWQCRPLKDPILLAMLEANCLQLHFSHAGIKIWTIMNHAYTAGIVGVVPFFRYVMFTQNLLNTLPKEEIQAVLIHEIGHNKYRHLLLYPFILVGMILFSSFFSIFVLAIIPEDMQFTDSERAFASIGLFLINIALFAIYFRLVFGFFSRLFERQADLYVFESTLSPHYMAKALNTLAIATGHSHKHPSWHHHSIQERIDFIESAIQNPKLVELHHIKVKFALIAYFMVLISALFLLFYFY